MKIWLNVIGSIAVVLAIVGMFLPLLPTTPFLLLASACFARGSQRMHGWLMANKLFGQYLRNIEEGKPMPRKAKVITLTILWASLAWSAYKLERVPLTVLLLAIGIGVTIYLVKFLPSRRRSGSSDCASAAELPVSIIDTAPPAATSRSPETGTAAQSRVPGSP